MTMATAIASLVRGEPVADDVGMTGEITLTGQVLPIGGLREKSLAAQRAGLKRVIFPRENEPDLDELPPETRAALEFVPADTIEDVFAAAFDGKRRAVRAGRRRSSARPLSQAAKLASSCSQTRRRRRRAARQSSWYSRLPRRTNVYWSTWSPTVDVVGVRRGSRRRSPSARRSTVPPVCCATCRHPRRELALDLGEERRPCTACSEREGRHLHELRVRATRRRRPRPSAHLPAGGRREA